MNNGKKKGEKELLKKVGKLGAHGADYLSKKKSYRSSMRTFKVLFTLKKKSNKK